MAMTCGVSVSKSSRARATPSLVKLETICGSERSSFIAKPSAMRSGQKASSTSLPSARSHLRNFSVIPGYTVLRKTTSCPSFRYGRYESNVCRMGSNSGFRCRSTGVPTTKTTVSVSEISDGRRERVNLPVSRTRRSALSAPSSEKGISPRPILSWTAAFTSTAQTRFPRSASEMPSGKPTCPNPPTMTTSYFMGRTPAG